MDDAVYGGLNNNQPKKTMSKLSKSTINYINRPWPETKLPRNHKHLWARLRYGKRKPWNPTDKEEA